jgi:hypothetical protein
VKLVLLDPLAIDNEAGMNVAVPVEELDKITIRVPSAVTGLPNLSCRCTVMLLDATPNAVVTAMEVNAICVAAPAEKTMAPLVTAVKPVSPAVAAAVKAIVSDFE